MANGTFVGVNDTARKVNSIYVGINGTARKIVKGYVGVNGVAQEVYADFNNWWLADGTILPSNVLGAYKFFETSAKADALKDLSGNGRDLTENGSGISYSATSGIKLTTSGYLTNSYINGSANQVKSIIVYYTGMSTTDSGETNSAGRLFSCPGGSDGYQRFGTAFHVRCWSTGTQDDEHDISFTHNRPTAVSSFSKPNITYYYASLAATADGVIGYSTGQWYQEGIAVGTTKKTRNNLNTISTLSLTTMRRLLMAHNNSMRFLAAVFYSVDLDADQHKSVSDKMKEMYSSMLA